MSRGVTSSAVLLHSGESYLIEFRYSVKLRSLALEIVSTKITLNGP